MTSALLFVSIVLNIIALFSIVILYLRQSKLFEVEKKQQRMIEEMEDVISTYLAEMKEENENFITKIASMDMTSKNKPVIKSDKNIEHEKQILPTFDEVIPISRKGTINKAVKAYQASAGSSQKLTEEDVDSLLPDYLDDADDSNLKEKDKEEVLLQSKQRNQSLFGEVLELKEEGLSIEEIAKKLHKGQTEIELLLKFRQNEQE